MIEENGSVAVIIVNYRTPDLAIACVDALRDERMRIKLEVVVVDGGSGDDSAPRLRDALKDTQYNEWVSFLPLELNGGFGWANNQAILALAQRQSLPEFIHLLNPDAVIEPGAIEALRSALIHSPQHAAAGSLLIDSDGSRAGSAFRFPSVMREFVRGSNTPGLGRILGVKPTSVFLDDDGDVDWITGASCMLRTAALRQTGLFDDGFFLYFEEVELMSRMKAAGWKIRHVPRSRVRHLGGASTGVNGHDPSKVARRPAYWYRSRRRYFVRTRGPFGATLASVAWLTGHMLWKARLMLRAGGTRRSVPSEGGDLLKHGFWIAPEDKRPAIATLGDSPGRPPAWMGAPSKLP